MNGLGVLSHFCLSSANDVDRICSVLKPMGITYFNYLKIYNKDSSRELLTNNPEWIEHFYKQEHYYNSATIDIEHLLPKGYFLWSELNEKDPIYIEGKEFFNIDNGISFVIKREDVTYLYIFASTRDNYKINNFYVKNIDLLQRFINYFNDKAKELQERSSKNRIYLPPPPKVCGDKINNLSIDNDARDKFLSETYVNKYYLLNVSDSLYLTPKQAECAKFLIKGMSAKQIGLKLKISNRTVESYLRDIKEKISNELGKQISRDQLVGILKSAKRNQS
jgi:DNA-binding CsgD family transcriptional regulator